MSGSSFRDWIAVKTIIKYNYAKSLAGTTLTNDWISSLISWIIFEMIGLANSLISSDQFSSKIFSMGSAEIDIIWMINFIILYSVDAIKIKAEGNYRNWVVVLFLRYACEHYKTVAYNVSTYGLSRYGLLPISQASQEPLT